MNQTKGKRLQDWTAPTKLDPVQVAEEQSDDELGVFLRRKRLSMVGFG